MLPFLQKRHDASIDDHDEYEGTDFGMMDAISQAILEAISAKDPYQLKDALEAFMQHINETSHNELRNRSL